MIPEDLKNREPSFLEPARKKVNGHRTWICPNCGNGRGRDGDGISLDPNSKNTPHYKCFKCGLYGDVIDLFRCHRGFSDNSEAFKAFCDFFSPGGFEKNGHYGGFKARRAILRGPGYNSSGQAPETLPEASSAPKTAFKNEDLAEFFAEAGKNIEKTNYHRGISLETLRRFNIGFIENWRHPKSPNSQPSARLIIPTSETSYLARGTVDDSKIKVGNVHIFNIDALRTARQPIFVVEGEIDALSIIDVGGEAIALGSVSNIGLLVSEIEAFSPARRAPGVTPGPGCFPSGDVDRGSVGEGDCGVYRQPAMGRLAGDGPEVSGPSNQPSAKTGPNAQECPKDSLAQRNNRVQASRLAPAAQARENPILIIALDNDEAGQAATEKLSEELRQRNISFYRADDFYGDFKDANEVLMRSRDDLKGRLEKTLQEALFWRERAISLERELYLKNSAENYVDEFINGVHDRACTACVPTGFRRLDEVLDGGLFEGLYVFGAISSLGKTTFALQIADQIAQSGRDVLIFSLEMARTELMAKSISRLTLLSGNHRNAKTTRGITMGSRYADYSVQELEVIGAAVERYRAYARNIFIHEGVGDIGTDQIRAEIERHIRVMGTKPVVVIDYVQILAPADIRATDKQNTDKAVLELKRISRDFKLPILGISSFNRMSYREAVAMSAFKESGSLEYGSDVLIGLQLKGAGEENFDVDVAKQADPRRVEVVILKNRNGATGKHIDFDFYAKFNYFEEKMVL